MLRWAVRLVLIQTAALAGLTILLAYADVTAHVSSTRMALSVTGYAVLMTLLFALVGVNLARRRGWARGPAIVLELLQAPIAYGMLTGGQVGIGAPILLMSLVSAALLLAPATRLALGRNAARPARES
jgi:hypothetical protein